ncbi:MAG: membrane protein insertase YidC [Lachnospiraceae bacterium]|nr:membrane protein insertase YidC [Lachnospiraceae bacterium]
MNILVEFFGRVILSIYTFTSDYGLAIVILTLIVRLMLLPVSIKQKKQAEKQVELVEEMEEIKKKYRKDKSRQEEALRELYAKKGIGGGACFTSLAQFPIMICLYNAIRSISALECGTIILPWITSLLGRDPYFLLPLATIVIQMLPQLYPHLRMFRDIHFQKVDGKMILVMTVMNAMFIIMIPSGVGLYYLVSGAFTAAEQFIYYWIRSLRLKTSNV